MYNRSRWNNQNWESSDRYTCGGGQAGLKVLVVKTPPLFGLTRRDAFSFGRDEVVMPPLEALEFTEHQVEHCSY